MQKPNKVQNESKNECTQKEQLQVRVCNQIVATISDPIEVKSVFNFTSYTLKVSDKNGCIQTHKRYSQFYQIREALLQAWPGCYVPPIPEKKILGNNQALFVQRRRQGLQRFLNNMAKREHLWYSQEFQAFLRPEQEKNLKPISDQATQIIGKYFEIFPSLKDYKSNNSEQIQKFSNYLKTASQIINGLKERASELVEAKKAYYSLSQTIFTHLLPELEKLCLDADHLKPRIFSKVDNRLTELNDLYKQISTKQELEQLFGKLEFEGLELEAFNEVYRMRKERYNKLNDLLIRETEENLRMFKLDGGKLSLMKSIMNVSIEEEKKEVVKIKEKLKENIQQQKQLCRLLDIILENFEIDWFKKEKVTEFQLTVKRIAHYFEEMESIRIQLWQHILQQLYTD